VSDSTKAGEGALQRVLGPFDATCVVIGAIIGVGIFFTPSRVALVAESGTLALVTWTVGGLIALTGALTFAELGGLYPRAGGQYDILRDAYGPMPAFLFVFCNATAIQAGASAIIAIVCAQNIAVAVAGQIPAERTLLLMSAALIAGLAVANGLGVRWGSRIQNATVIAKISTLLAVAAAAALLGRAAINDAPAAAAPARLGIVAAVCAALVPALFSFGGWQHALWMAGEVRQPRRNVPLAIVGGVVIVVAIYLLVNWAYLRLLGHSGVAASTTLAADAVGAVWPTTGPRVVAAAVAVSAFGVLNAQLLSGPRLICGMAGDGRFFRLFAHISPRSMTPVPAIGLLAVMALVLLFTARERGVDRLLTGVVFIDGVFFALTGLALLVLRRRRANAERPVRVPGYPVVPLLFVTGELGVVAGAYADPAVRTAALVGLAWIVAAAACYLAFFARKPGD
jgi:APA family basic amino acid/polyamine antiporter